MQVKEYIDFTPNGLPFCHHYRQLQIMSLMPLGNQIGIIEPE